MSKKIKFQINNRLYSADGGQTILDVALREGLTIPHLCKHSDLSVKANCRVCLVEVEGLGLVTSCSTEVAPSMKVKLETLAVKRARRVNLELIYAEHIEKCRTCLYEDNCRLKKYAEAWGLKLTRYEDRKSDYPVWQFGAAIRFDSSKCIECRNCVEVCEKQACSFYEIAERGVETQVKPKGGANENDQFVIFNDQKKELDLLKNDADKFDCTYCGQCVTHCPVGAISGVPHVNAVEELLKKRANKILVAQIAPSIRVSIGEEFGLPDGMLVTGQLAASLKAVGFDYAFDVNAGADFTTYEEARELVQWLVAGKDRPMFTSCCPAWVKFVEFYYPEFISHLTTTNSPQMCSGPVIKTFFADYLKKDPRDIVVVSIMPCTAKKHEIALAAHQIDLGWCLERLDLDNIKTHCLIKRAKLRGVKISAVDYVLTTREYAYLLHKGKINLAKLKPATLDSPLGIYSGAGAIYGASGGVMESALRSADYFFRVYDEVGSLAPVVRGDNYPLQKKRYSRLIQSRIEFKEVRGQDGIKKAVVAVGGRKLRVAVVNGLGNAKRILADLRLGAVKYDYVEVMACPGGCIGGGGQPLPVDSAIRAKRAAALYKIDREMAIRTAHENPAVLQVYQKYFKGDEEVIEQLLHTKFKVREREGYRVAQ